MTFKGVSWYNGICKVEAGQLALTVFDYLCMTQNKEIEMTKAEYLEQIKSDIKDYIDENKIVVHDERGRESLYNKLWVSDSVTGNASGSYTCNDYQAKQNVKDIIFEDETLDMFREFGYERIPLEKGAEFLDVSIRCFLLSEALDSVLNEMEQ